MTASSIKQSISFSFTPENLTRAKAIIAKYPAGRQASAVIPLLDIAQRQSGNWLPREAMDYVAGMLEMPRIRVYEVATFYTMFNKDKVGKSFIQICTTTPCWLRGSADIQKVCRDRLRICNGETTADGKFTVVEVECLGACVNAPMVQINDDYYEDLTPEIMGKLIDDLAAGKKPAIVSQTGRRGACAQKGPTSLKDKASAGGGNGI